MESYNSLLTNLAFSSHTNFFQEFITIALNFQAVVFQDIIILHWCLQTQIQVNAKRKFL